MATLTGENRVQHLDTSIARAAPTELPKLSDLVEKGDGGDYMSRLQAMASEQEGEAGGAPALAVGALDIDIGAILGPAEGHLRQARQLVEQEEYAEAIRVLDQALAEAPNHPEAIYMTALCLARLDQPIEALRALAVLRGESLTPAVQTRVAFSGRRSGARPSRFWSSSRSPSCSATRATRRSSASAPSSARPRDGHVPLHARGHPPHRGPPRRGRRGRRRGTALVRQWSGGR